MATKAELDLELRFMAIEYVLAHIGKAALLSAGITPEQVKQMREAGHEVMLRETFPGLDAAMGDHVSAELAIHVERLLGQIETLMADAFQKSARGKFEGGAQSGQAPPRT
jgi:hypothetical protein